MGNGVSRGQATIAVHNGSDVSIGHNLRIPGICKHEPHIDPNGIHEIWHHESLTGFYERVFQPAVDDYDKTARASRRIGNYLDKLTQEAIEGELQNEEIRQRNKEHKAKGEQLERLRAVKKPVYEMIVGVYPQDGLVLSEREQRELLHLWLYGDGTPDNPGFKERNPHLAIVGAYYHADEPEAQPHLHIDYVPVGEFTRGMRLQNSLERAFTQQGMKSGKVMGNDGPQFLTAQEQFQEAERNRLQEICEAAQLEIIHPQRGKRSRHLSTAEKKAITGREAAEAAQEAAEAARSAAAAQAQAIIAEAQEAHTEAMQQRQRAEAERRAMNERRAALEAWELELDEREAALDERAAELQEREAAVGRKEAALTAMGREDYGRRLAAAQQQRTERRSAEAAQLLPPDTQPHHGKRRGKIPPSERGPSM